MKKMNEMQESAVQAYFLWAAKPLKERMANRLAIFDTPLFPCAECGELVSISNLEKWQCDFDNGEFLCSMCYEDIQGEDL